VRAEDTNHLKKRGKILESTTERIGVRELLEAGVHFGHQAKRWNPKMKPYIFAERAGVHIIDLDQTLELLNRASRSSEGSLRRDARSSSSARRSRPRSRSPSRRSVAANPTSPSATSAAC
jgi:hypothetical protein